MVRQEQSSCLMIDFRVSKYTNLLAFPNKFTTKFHFGLFAHITEILWLENRIFWKNPQNLLP